MKYTPAHTLRPGDMIDLEPILAALVPSWDPDYADIARFEFATIEAVTDAEPVGGIDAVLIATDQHNVKVPAALGVYADIEAAR